MNPTTTCCERENFLETAQSFPTSAQSHSYIEKQLQTRLLYAKNEDFINSVFPNVSTRTLDIIDGLEQVKTDFQKLKKLSNVNNTSEKIFYEPMVKIGNAIARRLESSLPTEQFAHRVDWVDCSNMTPFSVDPGDSKIRTDIGLVITNNANRNKLAKIEKEIDECCQQIARGKQEKSHKTSSGISEDNATSLDNELRQLKKKYRAARQLSWSQFFAVAKINRFNTTNDMEQSRGQVLTLCHRVLKEQLDRLFVIGFTLYGNLVGLFLVDRAGAVAAQDSIDIFTPEGHRDFLRVLIYLSSGNPENLGWDTTMKLYNAPNSATPLPDLLALNESNFICSYNRDFEEWTSESRRPVLWKVSMPASGNNPHRTQYILVQLISGSSSKAFSSRAAMIWKAIKLGDPTRQIYIFKQSWRALKDHQTLEPGTAPHVSSTDDHIDAEARNVSSHRHIHEGRLWILGGQANEVESFEDVQINGGFVTINRYCRKNLVYTTSLGPDSALFNNERCIQSSSSSSIDFLPAAPNPIVHYVAADPSKFQDRSLSRTCLRSPGIPIKMFATITELLTSFRDAIQQHKDLYMAGVLHGDVSLGNLIICPTYDENTKSYTWANPRGKLIDLDHARHTRARHSVVPSVDHDDSHTLRTVFRTLVSHLDTTAAESDDGRRPLEDLKQRYPRLWVYARRALEVIPSNTKKAREYVEDFAVLDDTVLELKLELGERPNFAPTAGEKADAHTGTYPFMSCELLDSDNYRKARAYKPVVHDAVHDLDSFMACFFYLVLTRQGGGDLERQELSRDSAETDFVNSYFYQHDPKKAGLAKSTLLEDSVEPDEALTMIASIHPTFATLRLLVRQWAQVLHVAYTHRDGWEYHCIHDIVLHLFDKAIDEAKFDDNPTLIPGYDRAMAYRKDFGLFFTEPHDKEASVNRTPELI